MNAPFVVLISGSLRVGSTSDRIAHWCARQCAAQGALTRVFPGSSVQFPFYRPDAGGGHDGIQQFLGALARADGVVLVSPAYHGAMSGLLKNALDYVNDLNGYLDGRSVGCVAIGMGPQGAVSTLATLRSVSHALRAWPTPLGVTITSPQDFGTDGEPADPQCRDRLVQMTAQVLSLGRSAGYRNVGGAPRENHTDSIITPIR